ncbi:MAG: hypothetical protein L0G39_14395, partial [Chryseobacterium sp.]|nr:hypothetical protein [Chryseobacterium sp.]
TKVNKTAKGKATGGLVQQGFCVRRAEVQNSTAVFQLNISNKTSFCASIATPLQSTETLAVMRQTYNLIKHVMPNSRNHSKKIKQLRDEKIDLGVISKGLISLYHNENVISSQARKQPANSM